MMIRHTWLTAGCFSHDRIKLLQKGKSYLVTGMGTHLLVMKGLPEEGTEWEKSVSFMLVTGLGGLKENTVCTESEGKVPD